MGFGETIADGVLVEIAQATHLGMPIRFFTIDSHASEIAEISQTQLRFESEVLSHTGLVDAEMRYTLTNGRVEELVDALGRSGEVRGLRRPSRAMSL